jgi:RNase P/RNase MRP subunit p29
MEATMQLETTRLVVKDNALFNGGIAILGEVIRETRQMVTYREACTGREVKVNKFLRGIQIVDGEKKVNS